MTLSMKGVFVIAILCQITVSAATTQDVTLVRVDPDPQQQEFPCPHQSIEFRCQVFISALGIQWILPTSEMLIIGQAEDIGTVKSSSDNAYSATLADRTRDPDNANLFFFTSTLLVTKPVNGSSVTCVGVTGADPPTQSISIILSGTPDPPNGLSYDSTVVIESSVDLRWTRPSYTGGVDVVNYKISSTNGRPVTVEGSSEVVQYSPGLVYGEVQVSAINTCDLESQPATINIPAKVPTPPNIMVHFTCDSLPWTISWEYEKEEGVVYPNVKSTLHLYPTNETLSSVSLPSGDPACSGTTPGSTNCSLTVLKDIYNVSVSLTNDIGSVMNSSVFDTRPVIVENELFEEDKPLSVTVTVRTVCTIRCYVAVSFGIQPISNGNCEFQHNVTSKEPLSPGETYIFTGSAIALKSGEEYCYLVTLCGTPVRQGSGGGLSPGTISGSIIAIIVVLVILTLACCCCLIFLWRLRAKCYGCNKTDEEKSGLCFMYPLTIRRKLKSTKVKEKEKKEEEGQKELTEEEKAALYSVPDKKTKGKEVMRKKERKDEGQKELTEEEKAALYSVPDKKRQTTNGEEVSVQPDWARNTSSCPPPKRQKTNGEEVLRKEEEGQKELTEEEKAALYSVPDKKRVKIKSEGLIYADLVIMSNLNPAPPMPEEPAYTVVKME